MQHQVSCSNYNLPQPFGMGAATHIPLWQQAVKRLGDMLAGALLLLLLMPLLLLITVLLLLYSPGPVLFFQERIGLGGRPFRMIKFRSMIVNAEADGPRLSSGNDPRVTPIGRYLRKWRLDELPQLWNVLCGEMSLVGPRPERSFYINQILAQFPDYAHLLEIKPGITSWGMVQFGYAQNIAEMVDRARIDYSYIQHPTLLMDMKILLHTLRIIWRGKGK